MCQNSSILFLFDVIRKKTKETITKVTKKEESLDVSVTVRERTIDN